MNNLLIIFDLDGTLVDSIEGLAVSMNEVLKEAGYPIHKTEKYFDFVGEGIHNLVRKALPEEVVDENLIEDYYRQMLKVYENHYNTGLQPYDGIYNMLDELVALDVTMAIHTNKNEKMAKTIVAQYFENYEFLDVVGDDERRLRKPDPNEVHKMLVGAGLDEMRCLFVGDTEIDIQTARNAHVAIAAVSWGFRSEEVLAALNPTYMVSQPMDLVSIVTAMKKQS